MAGIVDVTKKGWKTQLIRELHTLNPAWTPAMIQREIEGKYPGHTVTLPTISYALKEIKKPSSDEEEIENFGSGVTPEFQQAHQPIASSIRSIPADPIRPIQPPQPEGKVEVNGMEASNSSYASVKQMMEVHRWLLKRDLLPSHIIELLRLVPSAKMLMEIMTAFDELEGK